MIYAGSAIGLSSYQLINSLVQIRWKVKQKMAKSINALFIDLMINGLFVKFYYNIFVSSLNHKLGNVLKFMRILSTILC